MIKMVTKRDGRVVPFDENKIMVAIGLSLKNTDLSELDTETAIHEIYYEVITVLSTVSDVSDTINVEDIQDIIIASMKNLGYDKSAKSFTTYRNRRTKVRERKTSLMKQISEMANASAAESDGKRENANIDGDTAMGTMLKFGTTTSKEYYLREVIPEDASNLHRTGYIHIHDMDFYSITSTCTQIPLSKLLKNGFSTGHGHLRTPNGINTAAALACICIQSNQNEQHGGQSIPKFDYDLAPYVTKTFITNICEYLDDNEVDEKIISSIKEQIELIHEKSNSLMNENTLKIIEDIIQESLDTNSIIPSNCINKAIKKTNRATYQAMEALIHNLNTMACRAGAQVPFSSVNFGTDTSPEGRMIIKNFLLALDAGLGEGETPIFPISIFKLKSGISYNPEDPNYDLFKLACKVSAKRLFPNFSNIDAPYNLAFYKENNPDTEIAYMGCVDYNEKVTLDGYIKSNYYSTIGKLYDEIDWLYNHKEDIVALIEEE